MEVEGLCRECSIGVIDRSFWCNVERTYLFYSFKWEKRKGEIRGKTKKREREQRGQRRRIYRREWKKKEKIGHKVRGW